MDENEASEGGAFHKNEVISAVANDGVLDDDYYEDLHYNINVGENNASSNVVNRGIVQRCTAASAGVLGNAGNVGNSGNDNMSRQGMVSGNATGSIGSFRALGGGTVLFVGDLLWWTTDAELEEELSRYGAVKEVIIFSDIINGKSKGYCQAEFYEPTAATACKEGMNGHVFNGRPCVVAFASPYTVRQMGEAQVNRDQRNAQSRTAPVNARARRGTGDSNNKNAIVNNFQGGGDNNRDLGRGNRGRTGPKRIRNRGPVGPTSYGLGGVAGRGFMGNAGGGYRQGIGAASTLTDPQTMMGQGFDPAFGGPMERMGGYGGFPVGLNPCLPGVAPHVNPAYFGRGMPMSGIGMMPLVGTEGPNMGGWARDEHGYRAVDSSYVAEPVSDHQYGEESRDRGAWERDKSGSSDKRYIDDREPTFNTDIARDKNTGRDHDMQERRRQDDGDFEREREQVHDSNRARSRDRPRSPRERSSRRQRKSRLSNEDDSESRSKDADHEKRRG